MLDPRMYTVGFATAASHSSPFVDLRVNKWHYSSYSPQSCNSLRQNGCESDRRTRDGDDGEGIVARHSDGMLHARPKAGCWRASGWSVLSVVRQV